MHYRWCYTFWQHGSYLAVTVGATVYLGWACVQHLLSNYKINYCSCSKQALIFSSFIAIFTADRVGRKDTLLIFANYYYLFIICASQHQSTGSEFGVFLVFLYVGWLLTGIEAGWTSVVVPVNLHSKATFCMYPSWEQLVYIVHDMKEFTLR